MLSFSIIYFSNIYKYYDKEEVNGVENIRIYRMIKNKFFQIKFSHKADKENMVSYSYTFQYLRRIF